MAINRRITMNKPNILWILAEDMCPNLGCYGDVDAITPHIDGLAEEGIRYNHVSSVGPVCSAARTTLALGMYPSTVGTGNHRSHVALPDHIKIFSEYLQEAGYYTAINKTDYNFQVQYDGPYIKGWDTTIDVDYGGDSEAIANVLADTWQKRKDNQPFFFMHTFAITHQSKYGYPSTPEEHRKNIIPRIKHEEYRDRDTLHIPSYHPDNQETREIWGQYHETITTMDRMVGETMAKLKEDGLYEDTIIFFFGDNGMGIPSGKFNMWREGTSVPLVIRVPEKYQHLIEDYVPGSVKTGAVSFADFAPTALELAGVSVPECMQGKNFLSKTETKACTFSYRNRIDSSCELVRSVCDTQFLYIRNFYPQKGWRYSPYIAISSPYFMTQWEADVKKEYHADSPVNRKNCFFMPRKPIEELYDLKNDSDQMYNLAHDPVYQEKCLAMRTQLKEWMLSVRDGGLIPEQELKKLSKEATAYDVIQNEVLYPMEKVLNLCDTMLDHQKTVTELLKSLSDDHPVVRYWAVQAIYEKGSFNQEILEQLLLALKDNSEMVQLAAAETLIYATSQLEYTTQAKGVIIKCLTCDDDVLLPLEALDCLDRMGDKLVDLIPYTKHLIHEAEITKEKEMTRYKQAVLSSSKYVAEKMGVPHDYAGLNDKTIPRLIELRALREANALDDFRIM